jgi:hypothetical protein
MARTSGWVGRASRRGGLATAGEVTGGYETNEEAPAAEGLIAGRVFNERLKGCENGPLHESAG